MSCERYEEGLIDHALGAPAAPEIQAHVASCAACRSRLEKERRLAATMDGLLASTLEVAPSPGFDLVVRRRVSGTRPAGGVRTWAWVAGGLATAAALILGLLLRPSESPTQPAVTENTWPPRATSRPETAPTTAPVVADERPPGVVTPRRAVRLRAPRPAEPEVLVPPTQLAILRRHLTRLRTQRAPEATVTHEPPLPFAPSPLEASSLVDLPRLSTSDDVPAIEPPKPLNRLVTGGDV
jgi:hypothetical protein